MTTSESMSSQQKPQKRSTKNRSFVIPAATPMTRLRQTSHKKDTDNNTIIKETETVSKSPEKDKLYSASVLIPVMSDILPLAAELQTPVKVRSTRRKAYLVNPVDSPINFLSPGPSKPAPQRSDSNKTKTTRKPSPGRTLNQQPFHGMVLRPKAAPVKKRKL
ncbi:uncharacterized protein LOC106882121 [Octopus bimaculoides]|uniref:Uncharacterized protein n=1 Tax=Octopus bimaculoides TaxID=37653 RepID=A0A0L8FP16_OCTBM|nr:uncharacterized protein LOC106882121 [Octopus bimaculoides]|eukprot:XP_014788165.1 PREDICTED: uncharacterized protein LOC106882121 [Octopus bimaculoides]